MIQLVVKLIFDIYIFIILFRFLLQVFRVSFNNPVSQAILRATNPLLIHIRKLIPGIKGIDLTPIFMALVLAIIENVILHYITSKAAINIPGVFIVSSLQLIDLFLSIFFYSIIIVVILSWVMMFGVVVDRNAPLFLVVNAITEPLFRFMRSFIPVIGGLDLSPMLIILAIVGIQQYALPQISYQLLSLVR